MALSPKSSIQIFGMVADVIVHECGHGIVAVIVSLKKYWRR